MNILLPWNTSYFIPLNAFHPLYCAFSQSTNDKIRYIIPRRDLEFEQYERLTEAGIFSHKYLSELWWLSPLTSELKKKFYGFYSLREINYIDTLPRDIEFLHTAPITSGNHDFVIHCESFLPFFMPFFSEGKKINVGDSDLVRQAYRDLLRVRCKAIVSHSKKTLKELSDFFSCPEIDKLLHCIDIGVTRKINFISSSKENKVIKFLFLASAHNNSNNFYSRGGVVSIKIALELLLRVQEGQKINKDLKFIFRTKRPDDIFFKEENINIKQLHSEELKGNIVWIENRLTQIEIDTLMAKSDFLLMLGASLHSDAIISAMRSKTVPIIIDSPDYANYVDKNSSIIINGIYKEIVDTMRISGFVKHFENYDKYNKIQGKIIKNAVNSITYSLGRLDKVFLLQENAFNLYLDKFSGKKFLSSFEDLLFKLNKNNINDFESRSSYSLNESYIEDIDKSWFETCPAPIVFANYGHGIHRKVFKQYCYIPFTREKECAVLETFSIINFIHEKYNYKDTKGFLICNDIKGAAGAQINLYQALARIEAEESGQIVAPTQDYFNEPKKVLTFKSKVSSVLIKYPYLHSIAYRIYKIMKRKL